MPNYRVEVETTSTEVEIHTFIVEAADDGDALEKAVAENLAESEIVCDDFEITSWDIDEEDEDDEEKTH